MRPPISGLRRCTCQCMALLYGMDVTYQDWFIHDYCTKENGLNGVQGFLYTQEKTVETVNLKTFVWWNTLRVSS